MIHLGLAHGLFLSFFSSFYQCWSNKAYPFEKKQTNNTCAKCAISLMCRLNAILLILCQDIKIAVNASKHCHTVCGGFAHMKVDLLFINLSTIQQTEVSLLIIITRGRTLGHNESLQMNYNVYLSIYIFLNISTVFILSWLPENSISLLISYNLV